MASYFDEHDCEPLADGQQPDHLLHMARLLLDSGLAAEWEVEYERAKGFGGAYKIDRHHSPSSSTFSKDFFSLAPRIFGGERKVPPASKKVVEELPTSVVGPTEAALEKKCPVCLGLFDEEDEVKKMPCSHRFHRNCIVPWLQRVNTCPVCRFELPTDDPDYENFRKHKARAKQREFELDTLHNSMFG